MHRIVAAAWLGRELAPGECIHHINGDRTDARPGNLRLYASNGEHMRHHRRVWSEAMDETLIAMNRDGSTAQDVADALGVPKFSVDNRRRRLVRYGLVPGRSRGTIQEGEIRI